jgi:hypothetical protein
MIHVCGESKTRRRIASLIERDQISKRVFHDRDRGKILEQRSDLSTNSSLEEQGEEVGAARNDPEISGGRLYVAKRDCFGEI